MMTLTAKDFLKEGNMAVFFKCKICGQEHKSPIAFGNKQSFDSSSLSNNVFQCAKTGKPASYDKKDMFWKEEN
jgi:hypothetical protein